MTCLYAAAAAAADDDDDYHNGGCSGEVKVTMDPQKHCTQFPKIFDHNARIDKTLAALRSTTHVEDIIKYVDLTRRH